ncbi:MAG: 5-hydroxyisourate hydrolase [Trebonia sp.]|jgi:5-hydroxyisourate hydrolase|nr:5-hydroxyisourate hydrolase [Trebonia sp.]
MTISTHVLDASLGTPAAGISVTLSRLAGGWLDVESGVTDPDGRHRFVGDTPAGTYCLTFATAPYFAARAVPAFYPEVAITFTIPEPEDGTAPGHCHVPLLLSPFAYSTYRGS